MTNPIFGDLSNAISSYPVNAPISAYGYRAPNYDSLYKLAEQIQAASQRKFLEDLKTQEANRLNEEQKTKYLAGQAEQEQYNLGQQKLGDQGINELYKQAKQQNVPTNRIQDFISGYSTNAVQGTKFVGGLGSVDPSLYNPIEKKYQGDINSATISKLQQIQGNEGKLRETSSEEIKKKDTITALMTEAEASKNTVNNLQKMLENATTPKERQDITEQIRKNTNTYEQKMQAASNLYRGLPENTNIQEPQPQPPPPPEDKSNILKDVSDIVNYNPQEGIDIKNNQILSGAKSMAGNIINEINPNSPTTPLNTVRNLNPATLPLGMLIQAYQSMPKAVRDKIMPPKTRA